MFSSFRKVKTPYSATCPFCGFKFNYMKYNGMSLLYPHFYCDTCSNVIRRESDFDKIMKCAVTEDLLAEIIKTLPSCPCGGQFSLKANPKCPRCKHELMHCKNKMDRLMDPYLIVMHGAKVRFK